MSLSPKIERFCNEYLVDLNGKQAAIRAGYAAKNADVQASKMLTLPKVKEFIDQKKTEIQKRLDISQDRVLREYARIAFFDVRKIYSDGNTLIPIKDMDDDSAAVMAGMDTDEIWEGAGDDRKLIGHTVKVKLSSKIAALDSLGKHLGLFEKDNGQKKPDAVAPMTNDQVQNVIKALRSKLKT